MMEAIPLYSVGTWDTFKQAYTPQGHSAGMESVSMKQATLFDDVRLSWDETVGMTIDSLSAWGPKHRVWCIAWSGGKDSTTLLTVIVWLITTGQIQPPARLIVCYADTRMELPPLSVAASMLIGQLQSRGIEVRVVMATMDKRFFVYMLGRGVPPPNNNTFRWCTRQIKVDPMQTEIKRIVSDAGGDVLMLTGVRQGESAIRDGRIAMSCGKNGAECGQGWYQQMTGDGFATLAPILHWRVCLVWEWLKCLAPTKRFGGWQTQMLADAYGGDEAEEINARTGCNGCPLANQDTALEVVVKIPEWSHVAPLRGLRPIYRQLREPRNRLRQPGGETRADGSVVGNQHRMGPLTMEARRWALAEILAIQDQINADAARLGRHGIDMLNSEEVARINELIEANTWPNKWTGKEPRADEPYFEHGQLSLME